jgi:pyroglutamyl-peptidase
VPSILITAFEPYDRWTENASWLALVELTRDLPAGPKIITRRYPVDFDAAAGRLREDLAANYDFALHVGQAPGLGRIHLEAIGVNVRGEPSQTPDQYQPLVAGGPTAYASAMPLADWAAKIRQLGIPCQVSFHAGTYLCNALLYLTHHIARHERLKTRAAFVHVPLAPVQILDQRQDTASLPSSSCAQALRLICDELSSRPPAL